MTEHDNKGILSLPSEEAYGHSPRRLCSNELFAGHSRLFIEHEGGDYLLQITRQGKLILTK